MKTKISKEAKHGFEWAVRAVSSRMRKGMNGEKALREIGIRNLSDTFFFFEYLRETGRKNLLKKITERA